MENARFWIFFSLSYFAGSASSRRGTIVFLHGAPTQSFSYRVVMSQVFMLLLFCMQSNMIFSSEWMILSLSYLRRTKFKNCCVFCGGLRSEL